MFKDYEKYLSTSLKVYLFVLIIIFILKLVGLDYFGLDLTNNMMLKINNFCLEFHLDILYSYIICFITTYITVSLTINENSKKLLKYILINFPITLLIKYSGYILNNIIYFIVQFLYLLLISYIYNKKIEKEIFYKYIKVCLLMWILQLLSMIIRNQNISVVGYDFLTSALLNMDYIIMMIISHNVYFKKGGIKCYQTEEVGSSSLKKLNLKNLLRKLQKNWRNFKKQDKVMKLTYIIYFIFSLIWNIFCIITVLFVAKLNDTFIECVFILTSFWLSKKSFGKAFHFSSMAKCFIVSNLSYYILNRITTPLGISIIVPILLGVGVSYITSKLVKKTYKTLYRGMPEELFEETILKVVDKNSLKYKICYDFYIQKKSIISLAIKYNYTESGIRKIKDRVNDKIKRL